MIYPNQLGIPRKLGRHQLHNFTHPPQPCPWIKERTTMVVKTIIIQWSLILNCSARSGKEHSAPDAASNRFSFPLGREAPGFFKQFCTSELVLAGLWGSMPVALHPIIIIACHWRQQWERDAERAGNERRH